MSSLKSYIAGLELEEIGSHSKFPSISFISDSIYESNGESGAVINYRNLQSFAEGLEAQQKEDAMNSMLIAQRAATKSYPDESQLKQWHQKYFEVLTRLGWTINQKDFKKYITDDQNIEIEKVLLEIIGATLTANQVALITKAIDALRKLGSDDSRFVAFERNTQDGHAGNFQVELISGANGTVSITSSSLHIKSTDRMTRILFFKTSREKIMIEYGTMQATLDESVYSTARSDVKMKLGDTSSYLAQLEI